MKNIIFISYRRDDTSLVARALAETLRYRLGAGKVFLDEDSIHDGEVWPERLENAVTQAKVVLALIGQDWLVASDQYGRRRLDIENDWVRRELLFAHRYGVGVIPVMIGNGTKPPPEEGLPNALAWLSKIEVTRLRNDDWQNGVASLTNTLINRYSFTDIQRGPTLPEPGVTKRDEPPLSEEALAMELKTLAGWEPVQSMYPPRREIRKVFHFKSFKAAIDFMMKAVPRIEEKPVHHPRWENQYKAVTVYFSTWDAGSMVTGYDIEAAKTMNKLYEELSNE
jgi:pterin-4a-carbinolamine dehydratase